MPRSSPILGSFICFGFSTAVWGSLAWLYLHHAQIARFIGTLGGLIP